jgi:hypothetical protein
MQSGGDLILARQSFLTGKLMNSAGCIGTSKEI